MSRTSVVPTKTESSTRVGHDGRGGGFRDEGFGGGGGWERSRWDVSARTYRAGIFTGMASITMLFAALTSALVVRESATRHWVQVDLPSILWLNTAILILSSLTLELSRRSLASGLVNRFAAWWYTTTGLGLVFIVGQLMAWQELASHGVYLATNPSSSFFYIFTAAHGLHLLGGIIALFCIAVRAGRIVTAPERWPGMEVARIYWHFLDGLWIYIFLLLLTKG